MEQVGERGSIAIEVSRDEAQRLKFGSGRQERIPGSGGTARIT